MHPSVKSPEFQESRLAPGLTQDAKLVSSFTNLEKQRAETGVYEVQVLDRSYLAHPQVFSPKYFTSTAMLSANFPFRKNERFLEVGCGIGVTSILAACTHGNRVVAVDLNPEAISVTRENAIKHGVSEQVDVRLGSVFDPIFSNEKFDTIYWDLPYVYGEEQASHSITLLQRSVCDPGYKHIEEFLAQAHRYVASDGRIIVGFGSNGDFNRFEALALKHNYNLKVIYQGFHPYRAGITYQLIELVCMTG